MGTAAHGSATKSRVTRQARAKAASVGTNVSLEVVLARDGMVCGICSEEIQYREQLTFDHVVPLARGGQHAEQNLQPAHRTCNSWKCDRLPEELRGQLPPDPGRITEADVYYLQKISAAKSAGQKRRLDAMTPEQRSEYREKIAKGSTPETIAKRAAANKLAWANKTPEEQEAWRARCREIKKDSPGNVQNLERSRDPEVQRAAIEKSAALRRGVPLSSEHRARISAGLVRAHESRRVLSSTS